MVQYHGTYMFSPCEFLAAFFSRLTPKELTSLVQQLTFCHNTNKTSVDPFNVVFTGVEKDTRMQYLIDKSFANHRKIPGT